MIKMFRLKYFESHQAVHVQKLDFDFKNSQKKSHSTLRAKRATFAFEWANVH